MDLSMQEQMFPSARIFCNPKVLKCMQTSPYRPFEDSKTFVDLVLKVPPQVALNVIEKLEEQSDEDKYLECLNTIFYTDLEQEFISLVQQAAPPDFDEKIPSFALNWKLCPKNVISFIHSMKQRWAELCREFKPELKVSKDILNHSSIIFLPHRFYIPGGRFRECYYWDTLWIVKGLVACDMITSAKDAIRNLLHLVDLLGFVPNGNRVYYLNRTQPPILTEAVRIVYDAIRCEKDKIKWLKETVPLLDKEIRFFHQHRSIAAIHPKSIYANRSLSMYSAFTNQPRPESFSEDVLTSKALKKESRNSDFLFHNIATVAESGWDFSSRWFTPSKSLSDAHISRIIPVCLNSILLRAERTLSEFYLVLGRASEAANKIEQKNYEVHGRYFWQVAKDRNADMMSVLWQRETGNWADFDIDKHTHTSVVSAAAVMPVWAGCAFEEWTSVDAARFVEFVTETSELLGPGGIACTNNQSGQQWDFPNCWAPLIDLAVEALQKVALEFPESKAGIVARDIAQRFVRTVFHGWSESDGAIHEKYNSTSSNGLRGEGGEYAPQTGFGWTNGTVLWLMCQFCTDPTFIIF